MALRFNGGRGAVTCDKCNIMIDAGIGPEEYKKSYGKNKKDLCWRCKTGYKETKAEKEKHKKKFKD